MARRKNRLVVGMFWGDEGKAKVVDYLTDGATVVVRYQGGANAGHSVEVGGRRFVLHQVPTGILHPDKICVLGAGMVIDLPSLVEELSELESAGVDDVEVVGVSTSICVMDTVGGLANRDYKITVPVKGVADFDPEFHEFALKRMKQLYGASISGNGVAS